MPKTAAKLRQRTGARRATAPADPERIDAVSSPIPAPDNAGPDLSLVSDCTARYAETLHASLLASLPVAGEVQVDAGNVERIDTACLQLLAAFVRDRSQAGRTVSWRGRSTVFSEAAGLLGLDLVLGLKG